jgi:acetyl esterase
MNLPESVEVAVGRVLPALPGPLQRALAGRPVRIDGQTLHPEAQLAVRLVELGGPSFETLPPPQAREVVDREARIVRGPTIEVAEVRQLEIPGPAGPVPARLYVPAGAGAPLPLVVYLHGGGWVVCSLDSHDQACRFLANEAGALVLALDYRLAPEHPFPAAVEDALAGFRYAVEEAESLGADPGRIAVAGDSAGGNLAAVIARLATREPGPSPAFQALIYPVTDLSRKRESYSLFRDGFYLTERQMDWYRDNYLPDAAAALDPRASPILAEDLAGLPPAYVVTAGFDVLRDEGEEYAARLAAAGVPVALRRQDDFIHAFVNAVGIGGRSREATLEIASALRLGLSSTATGAARAAPAAQSSRA